MTTYNRAQYIEEAIESVIASTYKNWELIIVDDCSTDNTEQLVKKYLVDNRIQYHRNEKNLGQFPNRNKAASLAKGKYIKYLDSDDMIYPHGLSCMIAAMEKFPEASLAVPHPEQNVLQPYPFAIEGRNGIIEHFTGKNYLSHGPTGTIFRKESFDNSKGFEEKMGILADTHLTLKIAGISKQIAFFQKDLYFWRIHNEQVTVGQVNKPQMIIDRHIINQNIFEKHLSTLSKNQISILRNLYTIITARHILRYLCQFRFAIALNIYTKCDIKVWNLITALSPFKKRITL